MEWLSPPLAADVLVSGLMTFQTWGSENSMSANVGPQFIVERMDSLGNIASTIINTERGVELPTSGAAQQWTATPTSTQMFRGDRFRVRMLGNDGGGTMATGFTFILAYGSNAAAATGDAWIRFTETITFDTTTPSGSPLYLVEALSDLVSGATVKRALSLTRGVEARETVTFAIGGFAVPITVVDGPRSFAVGSQARLKGGTGGPAEDGQQLAQKFHVYDPVDVDTVILRVGKSGTMLDNLVLDIVSTLGGSALGSSVPVVGSTLGGAAEVTFTFAVPVALSAGDYYLVLRRTGARDATNYYIWEGSASNPVYPDGQAWVRDDLTWVESISPASADRYFRIDEAVGTQQLFTGPLNGFTLEGLAKLTVRASASALASVSLRAELAVVENDGTNPVLWGAGNLAPENLMEDGRLGTDGAERTIWIAGDTTTVTAGQRLRLQLFLDDMSYTASVNNTKVTLTYNSPSAAAVGDTYLTLAQTITEQAAGSSPPEHLLHRNPYQALIVR